MTKLRRWVRVRWVAAVMVVAGLAACAAATRTGAPVASQSRDAPRPPADRDRVPSVLDDGWETASPEAVGMDRRALEAMTDTIRRYPDWNIHAVLIEREGRLVYEEYFSGKDERWGRPLGHVVFNRETKHDLRSVSKSIVSALVGIALASGQIASLDQPVLDFFPELADLATPERRRVTLRHALTMSAGFDWNESLPYTDPRNDEIGMIRSPDPIRYVLGRSFVADPASTWNYNGGLTQILGTIIQRSTGRPLREQAQSALFEPLGIHDLEWVGDIAGLPSAASGLRLRARDLAKFGALYREGGRWQGRQIVPADWVRDSTRRHLPLRTPVSAFGTHGYGYQWWHTCYRTACGTFETPTAAGNGQQRIYVLSELHLSVTVLAGRYNDPTAFRLPDRLLVEHVIPAARPGDAVRSSGSAACEAG